ILLRQELWTFGPSTLRSIRQARWPSKHCYGGRVDFGLPKQGLGKCCINPMGSDAEYNPDQGGGSEEIPPMRSQSALNLPPVVPLPESVNGNTLLHEIRQLLSLFVVLPMWAAEILSLWIVHTYAYELRQVAPYTGMDSPKERCGKTTLMTLLSELVDRPEPAANISSPALYRALEELRPT